MGRNVVDVDTYSYEMNLTKYQEKKMLVKFC